MGYIRFELENKPEEVVSYTEVFEKACPIYMLYGMSYEDFWYGDPMMAKYQRKVYELKLKKHDEILWEQGMYVYEAILECAPILHPFSKATKPLPYTEQPHLYQLNTEDEEEGPSEQEIENERLRAQLWAQNIARSMEQQFKDEK